LVRETERTCQTLHQTLSWLVRWIMGVKAIEAEALRLSGKDRARLAETLLRSLDEPSDDEIRMLWAKEGLRRYRAFKAGKSKAIPAEEALRIARERMR
jgi:putative addiction module component (TIGR02574 family)